MRILFLQPLRIYKRWPIPEDFTGLLGRVPTLALPQLAACLPGHKHIIMDGLAREYTLRELNAAVAEADVVMINAHSSIGSLNVEANVKHIKKLFPNVPVILGGHHATLYDREWIERGADYVVRNEGEHTIQELMKAIESRTDVRGIPGLTFRDINGTAHRNPDRPLEPDLDRLPIPDWSLLDPNLYGLPLSNKGFSTCVETSRGCAHRCSFCTTGTMWFHRQRFKGVDRVLEELRLLWRLGYRNLLFVDDNFGADTERDVKIFEGMLRERLYFKWMCFIRADTVSQHPDLIALAARAGLSIALVGFESNSSHMLKTFRKGANETDNERASAILRKNGVFIAGFFIVGYVGESRDETLRVLENAARLSDYPLVSLFEPRRGTEAFKRAKEANDLPSPDMFYHNTTHVLPSHSDHVLSQYRAFYRSYLVRQFVKLAFGSKTEQAFYKSLYGGIIRSMAGLKIGFFRRPWEMVMDIRE